MKKRSTIILATGIFLSVIFGVFLNIKQQMSIDRSRLPKKIEENRLFQRWITNIKNNDFEIEADEFQLKEENEIYNTTWMNVYSIDEPEQKELYEKTLEDHKNVDKVVFSPNQQVFVDYRPVPKGEALANEVRLYGLKEDKIIDARVLDCSLKGNCYFDRAYFLDNDVFVISEFSRDINKKDTSVLSCSINEVCTYTIKIHIVDMVHNKRLVYVSKPFEKALSEFIFRLYDEKL
jgi:hypothetical protein